MCARSVSENPMVVFQSSPSATNFCPDLRLLGRIDNGQIFGALLQVVQLLIPIEKWQWGYNGLLGAFVAGNWKVLLRYHRPLSLDVIGIYVV